MEPPDQPPSSVTKPMDAMRWAQRSSLVAWLCGVGSIGLAWGQSWWYVFYPHYLPLCLLFLGLVGSTSIALICCLSRVGRGPCRLTALLLSTVAMIPVGIWVYAGYTANSNFKQRWVPNTFAMRLARVMGATLMRAEGTFRYREKLETDRLVMFHRGLQTPEQDLAAMDQHIDRLENLLGGKLGKKVYWIRGRLLGQGLVSFHGLALGSEPRPIPEGDRPDYRGDRHELAHAVLDWFREPGSDPPNVLHEGWGMAQCGDSSRQLARVAARTIEDDPSVGIRELFGPEWYHRASGPVYTIGWAFVEFLVRTRGGPTFRRFYVECRPNTVDSKCREIVGVDLDALETEFWEDVEKTLSQP